MEARVAKLEASVSHIERDMAAVRTDVAVMWVVSAVLLAQLLPALLKKFGM